MKFNIKQIVLDSDLAVVSIPDEFPETFHLVTDRGEMIPVKVDRDRVFK